MESETRRRRKEAEKGDGAGRRGKEGKEDLKHRRVRIGRKRDRVGRDERKQKIAEKMKEEIVKT
jgi:hypothetical protein